MANFMPLLTELGVIGPKSINRSRLTALLIHGVLIGFSTEPRGFQPRKHSGLGSSFYVTASQVAWFLIILLVL